MAFAMRLLRVGATLKVAEVDQEPSMLDLVKSGVGLSLARNSIAIAEAHAHGLTIVEGVTVSAALTFICSQRAPRAALARRGIPARRATVGA